MSLWYDLKKKSYATNGKESWIKSYCDRAIELLSQKLCSHFNGAEGRHKAEDLDFEGTATVKDVIEQGFDECSRKNESLIASLETERSERETECGEIRTELQTEKEERIADCNEVRTELQNEIQAREEKINNIKEEIAPVLSTDELKVATLDETDSSVLCFNATDNYSAEGLEISFKAPCSKSEISRIDVTLLDGDMELLSEVEEVETTDPDDVEIENPLDPDTDESIEEPEEPDIYPEKIESFTFESGKDFKEGEYVTILFSGSTVEVKAVYQAGFYESRISENARDINILYRYDKQNTDDIFDNYENIRLLQDKTDALESEISDKNNWRLICNETLTEELSLVEVSIDQNGDSFALKRVKIVVYTDTSNGAYPSTGTVMFGLFRSNQYGAKLGFFTSPFPSVEGKFGIAMCDIEVIGTMAYGYMSKINNADGLDFNQLAAPTGYYASQPFPLGRDKIEKISVSCNSLTMKAGTRIEVWGINA